MNAITHPYNCKSFDKTQGTQVQLGSHPGYGAWQIATVTFLQGKCGYVWVNEHTHHS